MELLLGFDSRVREEAVGRVHNSNVLSGLCSRTETPFEFQQLNVVSDSVSM